MMPSTATSWETFSHDADIGVRGFGASPAQAFENAALALTSVLTDPARVECHEQVALQCQAGDLEILLVEFLNALIYEMDVRKMLFGRLSVRLQSPSKAGEPYHLEATAWGERVDIARHEPAVYVKGATLTELRVAQTPDGLWVAQLVVDV